MMRVSSYVIGAPLADDRFFILLHGIWGSLDKVPATTGAYLVEHRGRGAAAPPWDCGDATEKHLQERGYLTELSEAGERELMVDVATGLHDAALASTPPSFFFIPAYTCNLRCPYCFQSPEMHVGKGVYATVMTSERVDDAFRVIDRFDRPGAVAHHLDLSPGSPDGAAKSGRGKLGLFGGEPLQAATRDVVRYIYEQARTRGLVIEAITNGVQLDLFADLLGPDGLAELQITLDGMPDLHDRRRIGPRFRQTFYLIADNIDRALAAGVRVTVRINVDRSNADHLAKLDDLFLDRGWSEHPAFAAGAAVVTGEGKHEELLSQADLVELTSALHSERSSCVSSYESYAEGVLARALAGRYPFHRVTTCAAETGMLMFDPRGDLYGCWDEVGLADRRIGRYTDGVLQLDEEVARGWLSRFPGAIEQCSRCPYALIHTSGCGKHAYDASGSLFAAACESFQSYFPGTLAELYGRVENRLLGAGTTVQTRERIRHLPIVHVTNGRTTRKAEEV